MSAAQAHGGIFNRNFSRFALRVRTRLVLKEVLTGAALGLTAGAALSVLLWWQRQGELRPWTALLGLAGALVGAAYAFRRRWSDADVALYLDARLGSAEAISTAVELGSQAGPPTP